MSEQDADEMFKYEFSQLGRYENGRTPVLLNAKQYNRAKACVNACKDIDIGVLESDGFPMQIAGILALKQQRDELLAALEGVAAFWDSITTEDCLNDLHAKARAAIASAKGGAA